MKTNRNNKSISTAIQMTAKVINMQQQANNNNENSTSANNHEHLPHTDERNYDKRQNSSSRENKDSESESK